MAVTRIKNNQITDSTITAAKIASGTLTGGLFAADITLASNVTITGNLIVSGASDSISATNTFVNDPLVVFNNGFVGSPSYDIGILVNRNLTATAPYGAVNAALIWRESDKAFSGLMTTETGATTGTINNSGFANLKIGNVTANSLTLTTGTLTASGGITGTPISGSTGHFTVLQGTAFSTGNAVISGGYISALANITATNANFGTSTEATLNATAGNITTLRATNFNTGNAVISGGYISSLTNATITTGSITNLTSTTAVATNFSSGNARISGGYADSFPIGANTAATGDFTTLTSSGIAVLDGNVVAASSTSSTSTTTGALVVVGGAGFGGNLNVGGNITATSASTNITGTRFVTTNGLFWSNGVNALASAYSNVNVTEYLAVNTVPLANVSFYQNLTDSTTNATFYPAFYDKATGNAAAKTDTALNYNPSTGALAATSVTGNHYGTTAQFNNFSTGNAVISGGYISALANITATTVNFGTATAAVLNSTAGNITTLAAGSINTANAVISGGYISALTNATVTTGSITNLTSVTAVATNFSSSNVVITGGSINATTVGAITKATGGFTTLTATGVTTLTNGTAATSTSSGALQVTGGIGVLGNVWIGGNLYVANIVATSQSVLTVQDPLLYLTANNIYPYNYDIGFFSQFQGGSGNIYQHSGVARSQSNTYWGFFSNVVSEPGSTINWNDSGLIWDPIKAGDLELANTTASTRTTTGALTVAGGAGIAGNVNAGNVSVSMTTGTVMGNVGNFNHLYGTFYGTVAGGAGSANVSLYQTLTDASVNSSHFVAIYDKATGNAAAFTDAALTYNPSTGALSATSVTGNHYGTTAQFNNFSTGNAVISGGYISALTNATITTGSITNLTSTTAVATNFSSGNAQITGGSVTGLTNFSATTAQATNFSSGNAVISGGYISALTNATVTTGSITNLTSTTAVATNFSSGNVNFTGTTAGTVSTANVTIYQQLSSTNVNANLSVPLHDKSTGNAATLTSGNIVYNPFTNTIYIGAIVTNGGTIGSTGGYGNATVFSSLHAVNFSTANAVISGGYISSLTNATITTGSITNLTSTTAVATNFSSGNVNFTGTTSGTVSTANVSLYESVTATTTNATHYPMLSGINTGNTASFTASTLTHNPSTGVLAATTFSGAGTLSTLTTSGTIIASGNIVAAATTSSTSTTTGALVVRGGAGVAGNLNVGTSVVVDSGAYGNVTTTQYASVWASGAGPNPYSAMQVRSSDAVSGMGMQAYTGSATLYASTSINVITNATVRDRDVYSGGTVSTIFAANGAIVNTTGIASTTTGTGAVIITGTGGLGVGGAVNIGGNVYADDAMTINGSKTAGMDFVVRGKTDNTLIWARPGASYDQVVIGNSATTSTLVTGAKLIVNTTDSIMVPVGTTAQRPSSTGGTDTAGMVRYNSTSNVLEFYNGSSWVSASSVFTTVTDTQFNGDGSTVGFTSANFTSATTNGIIVSINGVVQIPSLAYSLTGTTITFTEAPASGDVIDVRVLLTSSTATSISSANGYMTVSADNNGVYITGGTAAATNRMVIDTSGNINISGSILPSANVTYNLGNATSWFGTFYGVSTQAKYADLAENYQADKSYNPGTVLMFGGTYEVTIADANTTAVAGVVSTNPAHLMNGQLSGSNVVPLALTGRVPCMVIGPVKKGDMMVSAGFGYAKSSTNPTVGQVIGKALEDYPLQAKGVIEVVVGRL